MPYAIAGLESGSADRAEACNGVDGMLEDHAWVLDALPDGLVLLGPDYRVVTVNAAAAKMLGVDPAAVRAHDGTAERLHLPEAWLEVAGTGAPGGGRQPLPSARIGGRADRVYEGEVAVSGTGEVALFFREVTEQQLTERQLVERNQQLSAARDELAARNRELHEATRAKDRFMATMSHEMRTPLNAILGYVDLLEMGIAGELTERQHEHLARVGRSGRALLELINDVLDFTRAEAGRLVVEPRPLRVDAVVEESVELVRPQAEAKGLEVVVEPVPGDDGWMLADFRRLRQILTNLLTNAVKFTTEGEVRVRFGRPSPDVVAVVVEDTGIGIERGKLPHIFTEFYQADSELTREYGGTGLGLAISERLARLMGGAIEVESERGKGSRFTLTLPAATARDRAAAPPRPQVVAPRPGREPETVTVVAFGQDGAALDALAERLQPQVRLIPTTAPDAVGELARRERASLVVLDVACQNGAGWEAAHSVREDPALDDVAMLLLPCFPDVVQEGSPGALDLGWVAVVPKPVSPDQLSRMVERAGGDRDGKRSVLVVDDDPDAREIAARILRAAGAVVREARDGEEGLAAMRDEPPDVAVLDLMLPVLDGFGVLAAMRSDPRLQSIPVVVLTAKDLSSEERRFLSRTAESVLQKGIHTLSDVTSLVIEAAQGALVRGGRTDAHEASSPAVDA